MRRRASRIAGVAFASPPPSDPFWAQTAFLMLPSGATGSSASIVDLSTAAVTITRIGSPAPTIEASAPMVGVSFPGNGTDYLTLTPTSDLRLIGDYTLEMEFVSTALANQMLLDFRDASGNGYQVFLEDAATLFLQAGGGSPNFLRSGASAYAAGVKTHVAFTKEDISGTPTSRVWINGIKSAENTGTTINAVSIGEPYYLGVRDASSLFAYTGKLGPTRITTACRYSADFTPPTVYPTQ